MAAPAHKTLKSLDGKWVMNKSLSDPTDPILTLQGIPWLTRKAINLATVTLHVKSFTAPPAEDPNGDAATQFVIEQVVTGGIKGTTEKRTLDWKYRPHSDWLFGDLQGRSRWNTIANILKESAGKGAEEVDAKYICSGWLPETLEGDVVDSYVDNDERQWTTWQIWGFSEVNGQRMMTRRFAIRKKDEDKFVHAQLVYEWVGELDG